MFEYLLVDPAAQWWELVSAGRLDGGGTPFLDLELAGFSRDGVDVPGYSFADLDPCGPVEAAAVGYLLENGFGPSFIRIGTIQPTCPPTYTLGPPIAGEELARIHPQCKAASYHIGGRKVVRTMYSKNLNGLAMDQSQYMQSALMSKNNLPTPPCKAPFPGPNLANKWCGKSYVDPLKAQLAGLLPINWGLCQPCTKAGRPIKMPLVSQDIPVNTPLRAYKPWEKQRLYGQRINADPVPAAALEEEVEQEEEAAEDSPAPSVLLAENYDGILPPGPFSAGAGQPILSLQVSGCPDLRIDAIEMDVAGPAPALTITIYNAATGQMLSSSGPSIGPAASSGPSLEKLLFEFPPDARAQVYGETGPLLVEVDLDSAVSITVAKAPDTIGEFAQATGSWTANPAFHPTLVPQFGIYGAGCS